MVPSWLHNAIFYEIYPPSFFDSNGDGIGDINGIRQKLAYVKSLGCNALWLNPCFDSPFKDGGYDVRDFKKVAPRYGTNEEIAALFEEAHKMGIRVLLDLVICHSSEEHPWFVQSCKAKANEYTGRYIWTGLCFDDGDGMPFVGGESERSATYIISFFKCQPALNFGYHNIRRHWQQPIDSPDALATQEAMMDVMRFWLKMGCDGFRVDMAGNLVKNDPDHIGTTAVWRRMLSAIKQEFPEAAFVSEWSEPEKSLSCGFDMDFFLGWPFDGYNTMIRNYDTDPQGRLTSSNDAYFVADSSQDVQAFLADYVPVYEKFKDRGYWCLTTGNHDVLRPTVTLSERELCLCYGWILTMPGAPYIYYGDEIGMRWLDLPTKEGGYYRTGSRTPMQWDHSKNMGFSNAESGKLYLPQDPNTDAPTVASQEENPTSLLNTVRQLTTLRHQYPQLQNSGSFEVFSAVPGSKLFAYKRGDLLVSMNPGIKECTLPLDRDYEILFSIGSTEIARSTLFLGAQSLAVLIPKA